MAGQRSKWIMECQRCGDSLTIIYHPEKNHSQVGAVKAHLALLMKTHLDAHNEPFPPDLKEWIRKVKPYPFNDQGTKGRGPRGPPGARQHHRRRAREREIPA